MVGNGHYIKIWEDRWLPNHKGYKIISSQPDNTNMVYAKDLIKDGAHVGLKQ
jgi:myo-inositol-hexaphosphate 3-phosphohydrolase